MREKIAGVNVTGDRDHVHGVVPMAFVALKRLIGQILQMDVMALSEAKQGMNVPYNQVSKFIEDLTPT